MNATFFLRPVHAWFFLWERVVPSLYRVVATGLAAFATAPLLTIVGLHPLLAAPISLAVWIGLAVAQEHDERILLPPNRAFLSALTEAVSAPPLALAVDTAHGSRRARPEPWDTMIVLTPNGAEHRPLTGSFITGSEVQLRDGCAWRPPTMPREPSRRSTTASTNVVSPCLPNASEWHSHQTPTLAPSPLRFLRSIGRVAGGVSISCSSE